jgi:hypothetical protein
MHSNRRSAPLGLDHDFELGTGVQSPKFTPTTTKGSPRVTVSDWSSSHPTMVSSLKVDDERAVTPSSFRTIGQDGGGNGSHGLREVESRDELVATPTRARFDHGNQALHSMESQDELIPTPTRSRQHVLQPMESQDQLIPSPTRSRFEYGNYALHPMESRDELVPSPTRSRFDHGGHALRAMDSQDELVRTPTRSVFEHDGNFV